MILGYTHLKKTPYYINVYTMRYNEDVHGLASSFASSGILWVYTLYRLYLSSTSQKEASEAQRRRVPW